MLCSSEHSAESSVSSSSSRGLLLTVCVGVRSQTSGPPQGVMGCWHDAVDAVLCQLCSVAPAADITVLLPPPLACCFFLQAVLEQRAEFGKRVVRKVPVEWIGVASEVKVMGDFDGWTRGHELSAEDVASDSVYSRCVGGWDTVVLCWAGLGMIVRAADGTFDARKWLCHFAGMGLLC